MKALRHTQQGPPREPLLHRRSLLKKVQTLQIERSNMYRELQVLRRVLVCQHLLQQQLEGALEIAQQKLHRYRRAALAICAQRQGERERRRRSLALHAGMELLHATGTKTNASAAQESDEQAEPAGSQRDLLQQATELAEELLRGKHDEMDHEILDCGRHLEQYSKDDEMLDHDREGAKDMLTIESGPCPSRPLKRGA